MNNIASANEYIYGRVISGLGGLYDVETSGGVVKCRARGVFRSEGLTVTVGDNVGIRMEPDGSAAIMEICERKSILIRPPLANLDMIFITIAAAKPMPALDVVDKLSCIARHNGIDCGIIVTKCELDEENAERIAGIYSKTPYHVFLTSVMEGRGVEDVRNYITANMAGKICAFAGASGVGKSTLLSAIFPDFKPDTGSVSRIGRGRHTTRAVTLYDIPGTSGGTGTDASDGDNTSVSSVGVNENATSSCGKIADTSGCGKIADTSGCGKIADTPGFSLLDFTRFDFFELKQLADTFPEFDDLIGTCRYTKCTHLKEEGCSIVEAVRDGVISKERHNSYVALFAELKEKAKHKWD